MKRENMEYGRRFPLEGYTNEFMHGALIISPDSTCTIDATCAPMVIDGVNWPEAQSLAVLDEDENVIVRAERGQDGHFRSAGEWNSDAIDLEFLLLDENGNGLPTAGKVVW